MKHPISWHPGLNYFLSPSPKSNIPHQFLNPGTWEMLDSENGRMVKSLEAV